MIDLILGNLSAENRMCSASNIQSETDIKTGAALVVVIQYHVQSTHL